MEAFVNFWGGEGILSATAFFILGAIGLLDDVTKGDVQKIHTNLLDLENANNNNGKTNYTTDYSRALRLEKTYEYYCRFFRDSSDITFKTVSISDVAPNNNLQTLKAQFSDSLFLRLGCTEEETRIVVTQGIYGRPWLGEVFYSNSSTHRFNLLYSDRADDLEALIINCGGYRGGGTAATFIPLENKYDTPFETVHRYSVISGPATKFECVYMIPFPEIYPEKLCKDYVDIFDISELIKKLSEYTLKDKYIEAHQYNLKILRQYASIGSKNQEIMTHLNPALYASRFIDMLYSDSSAEKLSGIFVNIKTDGYDLLDYDVTSREYQPKEQDHKLHISNLVNAVSIVEIVVNHATYDTANPKGTIYSFGTACGNSFSPHTLFDQNARLKYNLFLIMAVMITYYIYPMMMRGELPPGRVTGTMFGLIQTYEPKLNDTDKERLIKSAMPKCIDFMKNYLCEVLRALADIALTSNQSAMIPDGMYFGELINRMESSANNRSVLPADDNRKFAVENISHVVRNYKGISTVAAKKLVEQWLSDLIGYLPNGSSCVSNQNVDGERYFKELVKEMLNQESKLLDKKEGAAH